MLMNTREKRFVLISLLYIAYMVVPIMSALLPIAIVSIVVAVLLYALYPRCFRQDYFLWFLVYIAILVFYSLIGHKFKINGIGEMASIRKVMIETVWILPNLMICSIVISINNPCVYRQLAKWMLILLVVPLVLITPVIWSTSGILRENIRIMDSTGFGNPWLPNYTLMSCYSFLIPVLGYGYRSFDHKINNVRWLFLGMIILFVYFVYKSEITTSLVSTIFIILFIIIYQRGGNERTILLFLDFLVDAYEGTVAQIKIIEFRDMLMGEEEEGNVQLRAKLREMSFNCFLQNPLIGTSGVGGHSSIMDRLGSMGLLGFIPFIMMIILNIKMWYKLMPEKSAKYFYIGGVTIMAMFLYVKGLFSGQGMLCLFFVVPVTIIGIYHYFTNMSNPKYKLRNNNLRSDHEI